MRTLGYALACLLITSVLHVRVAAFVTRGHGSVKAIGPDSTASSGKEIAPASRQTPAWMASPSGEMTPGSKLVNPEAKVQDEMMQLMRDEMDEKQNKLVDTTGQHYKVTCDASAEKTKEEVDTGLVRLKELFEQRREMFEHCHFWREENLRLMVKVRSAAEWMNPLHVVLQDRSTFRKIALAASLATLFCALIIARLVKRDNNIQQQPFEKNISRGMFVGSCVWLFGAFLDVVPIKSLWFSRDVRPVAKSVFCNNGILLLSSLPSTKFTVDAAARHDLKPFLFFFCL